MNERSINETSHFASTLRHMTIPKDYGAPRKVNKNFKSGNVL